MEYRRLGRSSLNASLLGLGCNNFGWFIDKPQSISVVHAAIDAGMTFFDTANNYGMPAGESERILGEAVAGRRADVIIATKFGDQVDDAGLERGAAPAYILRAVEQSLRNLNTDYIDLYQLHYPDPDVPIADTLGALQMLVEAGKIREIGCANMSAAQLAMALDVSVAESLPAFVSCQNEYSLLARGVEDDLVPLLMERQVGFLPFFPLANGLLTGKYRGSADQSGRLQSISQIPFFDKFLTQDRFTEVERLAALAESHGITLLEMAFGWLKAQPHVTSIIAGATSPEQVRANAAAVAGALAPPVMAAIDG
jgi:aryl-alcohol dehydrogenase-like predicted oxidoreductase